MEVLDVALAPDAERNVPYAIDVARRDDRVLAPHPRSLRLGCDALRVLPPDS